MGFREKKTMPSIDSTTQGHNWAHARTTDGPTAYEYLSMTGDPICIVHQQPPSPLFSTCRRRHRTSMAVAVDANIWEIKQLYTSLDGLLLLQAIL